MKVVYGSGRTRILLGQEIGVGGEATVYGVAERPDLLAKIYNPSPRPGYDKKLAWMRDNPPDDPTRMWGHASIAWPLDLLYTGHGQFVGYVMHRIRNAVPLLEVFNPRLRARTLPDFDWRYLHRTARNLAVALGALHVCGYVVGDLNESNVMVTPSAMVTLIDTDSFQVRVRSKGRFVTYFCPVGKLEYTPPELQGRSLQHTRQHPEHDCFGLGVLIFQLLMGGSHPFRAQWLGQGDPPPINEKIRRGAFPYMKTPSLPIAPPRNVRALDSLYPALADLVRQCFIEGHKNPARRPTSREWEEVITKAEKALVQCTNGHHYSNHLRACPSCGATRRGLHIPLPFARPTAPAQSTSNVSVAQPGTRRWLWPPRRGTGPAASPAIGTVLQRRRGTIRWTPSELIGGATTGALIWASGGAVFGAIGGAIAGATGIVIVWAIVWAVMWAAGWWAFGEVLGETVGGHALGKAFGVGGAVGGATAGGLLGLVMGETGVEGLGGQAAVSVVTRLVGGLVGEGELDGVVDQALMGLVSGALVWGIIWMIVGALGGAIGWSSISRHALSAGFGKVPGKMLGVVWATVAAVEGASAAAIGGVLVGAVVGVIVGGMGGIVGDALPLAVLGSVAGAVLGAIGGSMGRPYVVEIGDKFSRAFGILEGGVGFVAGLAVARGGLDPWAIGQSGLSGAVEGALGGLASGALVGLICGALVGAVTGAILRATDV